MLVSIIVPIFNSELTLSRCIESILTQNFRDFELILVNDGSTDNSLKICYEYEKKDSRIKVLNQSNSGVSVARNYGLRVAQGEFISFIDSDDYIAEDFYSCLTGTLIKSGADVLALSNYTIKRSRSVNQVINSEEAQKKLLLLQLPTSVWAYLYRSKDVKKIYFSKDIHFFEDFLFNFEFLCTVKKIQLYSYDGYHYTVNPDSANTSKLSEKKLSCLSIPLIIKLPFDLEKELSFFHSHCLISLILSMSKDKDSFNRYGSIISKECKSFIPNIKSLVPWIYKVIIILTAFFPGITTSILRLTKGR